MNMEFIGKHTIYVVVSISDMVSNKFPESKIEGYYAYENAAAEEAKRLGTWKTTTVVPYSVTLNDLIRVLNEHV